MKYFFIEIFFGKIIFFFYIIVLIKTASQIFLEENMVIVTDNSIYKQKTPIKTLFISKSEQEIYIRSGTITSGKGITIQNIIYKLFYSTFLMASRSFRTPPSISLFESNLNILSKTNMLIFKISFSKIL